MVNSADFPSTNKQRNSSRNCFFFVNSAALLTDFEHKLQEKRRNSENHRSIDIFVIFRVKAKNTRKMTHTKNNLCKFPRIIEKKKHRILFTN